MGAYAGLSRIENTQDEHLLKHNKNAAFIIKNDNI